MRPINFIKEIEKECNFDKNMKLYFYSFENCEKPIFIFSYYGLDFLIKNNLKDSWDSMEELNKMVKKEKNNMIKQIKNIQENFVKVYTYT